MVSVCRRSRAVLAGRRARTRTRRVRCAIGGNPGAFARGFTTGPDVYMVAFNRTTNVVSVFLDQRPNAALRWCRASIRLVDANGSVVGNPVGVALPVFPNPGPVQVTFDVNPSVMALNPVSVQLFGPSVAVPPAVPASVDSALARTQSSECPATGAACRRSSSRRALAWGSRRSRTPSTSSTSST